MNDRRSDTTAAINVWYGDHQLFGAAGRPQRWINVLGRLYTSEAGWSLTAALNDATPQAVPVGPNRTRLSRTGDFNLEFDYAELRPGDNHLLLAGLGRRRQRIERRVTLHCAPRHNDAPLPHRIEWKRAESIQHLAQVVDGHWTLTADGIRCREIGYDRCVALGDVELQDYEVTLRFVAHEIAAGRLPYPSIAPGLGIVLHWRGHVDAHSPAWKRAARRILGSISDRYRDTLTRADEVPRHGWWDRGAAGWYGWHESAGETGFRLALSAGQEQLIARPAKRTIELERPYRMKMRVQSRPPLSSLYALKLWAAEAPEPTAWDLLGAGTAGEPDRGAVLLVAHHVDVTFGDVVIGPIQANEL